MNRRSLILLVLMIAGTALSQPAEPAPAQPQPAFPAQAIRDSTEQVPLFRPKVVMHREVILPKDPFLAGALSLVLPGTGQAYCGKWLKGVGFLAGALVCYGTAGSVGNNEALTTNAKSAFSGGFALIGLAIHVWSVMDGVSSANAHNRQLLETP